MDLPLASRMAKDWNERAVEDALWYVVNYKPKGELTVPELIEAGEGEMLNSLVPFLRANKIKPDKLTCLEIGCGVGRLTSGLARRFAHVIAGDVSKIMTERAREITAAQELKNIEFITLSGVDLAGVENASVDFVYSCIVFQHIPDPAIQYNYLEEVFRVLKPGGAFLLEFYPDTAATERIRAGWEQRRALGDAGGWGPDAQHELSRYETFMCTAIDKEWVRKIVLDYHFNITADYEVNPEVWWIGGVDGST